MKPKLLLVIPVIFAVINSCNNAMIDDMQLTEIQQKKSIASGDAHQLLNEILPVSDQSNVYVNIINNTYCFTCYPVFSLVADELKKGGLSHDNLVYVFPSMRKVMQNDFLAKNFNLHADEVKVIFNDDLYNYLQEEYHLNGSSQLLRFNGQRELIAKAEYDRANVSEILSIVN